MTGKRLVWYSIGLKVMIVFFVISLAWGHKLISQKWFDPLAGHDAKLNAVRYKEGNINARDEFGYTGLMRAIEAGDVELTKEFMFRGADITAVSYDKPSPAGQRSVQTMLKTTALHVAVASAAVTPQAEIEILKFIFDFFITRKKEGKPTVDIAKLVNARDAQGNAPIHLVVLPTILDDRITIVNLLLAHGADINAQNNVGDTMLHSAVRRNDRPWIERVLKNYKKVLNTHVKNKDGQTIKDLASALNLRDVVTLICRDGGFICQSDETIGVM